MRALSIQAALLVASASPLFAAETDPSAPGLMSLRFNLMFWTLLIFVVLFFVLKKYAFAPILAAVDAREKALEEAIEGAKADRAAAALLLEEHRAAIAAARDEAQQMIADGRATTEKMRHDLLEQTRQEQQEMLNRAKRDIESERDKAIAQMRREAVDLAIAGATRVVEANMDTAGNRRLVESFLAGIGPVKVS